MTDRPSRLSSIRAMLAMIEAGADDIVSSDTVLALGIDSMAGLAAYRGNLSSAVDLLHKHLPGWDYDLRRDLVRIWSGNHSHEVAHSDNPARAILVALLLQLEDAEGPRHD